MRVLKIPMLMMTSYKEVELLVKAVQGAMKEDNDNGVTENFDAYKIILSALDKIKLIFRNIEIESGGENAVDDL